MGRRQRERRAEGESVIDENGENAVETPDTQDEQAEDPAAPPVPATAPSSTEPMSLSEFAAAQKRAGEPAGKIAPVTAPKRGTWVIAKETGIHGNVRRRKGARFLIHDGEKLAKWMEPASAPTADTE